jgi:hypothetical protein
MTGASMKDYESGFLALILTGILVLIIGLGLMVPVVRSPNAATLELVQGQAAKAPSAVPSWVLAMRPQPDAGTAPTKR